MAAAPDKYACPIMSACSTQVVAEQALQHHRCSTSRRRDQVGRSRLLSEVMKVPSTIGYPAKPISSCSGCVTPSATFNGLKRAVFLVKKPYGSILAGSVSARDRRYAAGERPLSRGASRGGLSRAIQRAT